MKLKDISVQGLFNIFSNFIESMEWACKIVTLNNKDDYIVIEDNGDERYIIDMSGNYYDPDEDEIGINVGRVYDDEGWEVE